MIFKYFLLLLLGMSSTVSPTSNPLRDLELQAIKHQYQKDLDIRSTFKAESFEVNSLRSNKTSRNLAPLIQGGDVAESQTKFRRQFVKKMMKHAWDGYVAYAWGQNEVRPVSKSGNQDTVFGSSDSGATIVDSMDTLYIMGLDEEFAMGRKWISRNLNLSKMSEDVSVFETNIRYVGGLLSTYAFVGDEMFKIKAVEIVDKLLPAFDTPTGIPRGKVNMQTGFGNYYGGSSVLSEFGTLHMEFSYLSDVTGNPVYKKKVEAIRNFLENKDKDVDNLYPNYLNFVSGDWGKKHCSIGAMGDSFYEYLLKEWLRSGKVDRQAKEMFEEAIDGIEEILLQNSSDGHVYIADLINGRLVHKMDHLACFAGGMFALAARDSEDNITKSRWMKIAEGITATCHQSYNSTATKLGPEVIRFDNLYLARDRSYLLRPETVESYFILWRLTKDPKYREWGWEVVQALEKNCKVEGGYSGLKNVNVRRSTDDVQQSFFLAETLKYLYLLFSEDELLDLQQWVFNTEAHPLPVKGLNPLYRGYRTLDTRILHTEL